MKVLLTGAAGFIGRYVHALLTTHGHTVVGIDSYEDQVHGPHAQIALGVSQMRAGSPRLDTAGIDGVIHLGASVGVGQSAERPAHYVENNAWETATMLERLLIGGRTRPRVIVVASSMSIYGEGAYQSRAFARLAEPAGDDFAPVLSVFNGGLARPKDGCWDGNWNALACDGAGEMVLDAEPVLTTEAKTPEPASIYAMTKYDQEMYTLLLSRAYGVRGVALRFWNTYGPGQALSNPYTGAVAMFLSRAMLGRAPIVFEDGQQTRDLVYVTDVARAVVLALETEAAQGPYNVCTGLPTTVGALADACTRIVAEQGGPVAAEPRITGEFREGDVRHCIGDPRAFAQATGWEPKVSLAQGIEQVARWCADQDIDDHLEAHHARLRELGLLRVPA